MNWKLLWKSIMENQNAMFSRLYYTNRTKKITLYSKISPLGDPGTSVVPELENWARNGNKVGVGELQRILRDLRKRKRFSQALEVSDWMNTSGICIFSPTEQAVHLDLIGRVNGYVSAEHYFNGLRERDKIDKTYGALLNCYVRQRQTDKAISLFQKMKQIGFASSPLIYNDIMCLYAKLGEHEKVLHMLTEMKDNGVSPDNFSYRICINSYGATCDLKGMQQVLNEMECQPNIVMDWNTYAVAANVFIKAGLPDKAFDALKKSEGRLSKKDGTGYNHLISLYATLGSKSEVMRLWDLEKNDCKRCINRDYINILESLVKLGELEEAEKILKEWESSGNCYDVRIPNIILTGYIGKGFYEQAEALLKELIDRGKFTTSNSWGLVAARYLDLGNNAKAFNCMKIALSLNVENKGWKPNPRMIAGILEWLGNRGDAEDTEGFVALLRSVMSMNREM
uniref:Pentatricopeptide repeat-containing protein At4g21705 isoform X1 n=2 Tax=Rhizophora mucronata TaxID=61149 RepID=A0A2P2IQ59_RHIMU